jgi:ubiquinone/menaquinone biosynthesis C-methylase UbiE
MELNTAIRLIEKGVNTVGRQLWADLGAGSGLFTQALATLLEEPSTIFAIDKQRSINEKFFTGSIHTIKTIEADFTNTKALPLQLNGILLANSLHYVSDKQKFLKGLKENILPSGSLIILEYEMTKPNPWVPYPVTAESLRALLMQAGYKTFEILDQHPSTLNGMTIYSSLARVSTTAAS